VVDGLRQFFSVETFLGIQAAAIILFVIRMWNGSPAMFAQWIAYRRARAEEKSADWERIRYERDASSEAAKVSREEIDMLRDRLAERDSRIATLMGENAELRGILQSIGEWRQFQAYRDALRRQDDPAGNGDGK
jgi:uncharacterized coiled-coil DUF342 family protein